MLGHLCCYGFSGACGRSNESYDSVTGTLVTMKEIQCVDLVKEMVWIDDFNKFRPTISTVLILLYSLTL